MIKIFTSKAGLPDDGSPALLFFGGGCGKRNSLGYQNNMLNLAAIRMSRNPTDFIDFGANNKKMENVERDQKNKEHPQGGDMKMSY